MERRPISIYTGEVLEVPTHIVRLDTRNTHGWQLRYGKWKMYSDRTPDGSGAKASLEIATIELAKRIDTLKAPSGIRTAPLSLKKSDLPVGISGPREISRKKKSVIQLYFQVTYPIFGSKPANKQVYIATVNTFNQGKYDTALAKCAALRREGLRKFDELNTKAKRDLATRAGISGTGDA